MTVALVTGGEGFLGCRVVHALKRAGADVRWTSVESTETAEVVRVDLRKPGVLDEHLEGVDVVVHLAARAGGVGFQAALDPTVFWDNRAMTDTVLAGAVAAGVTRVFLASSSVVYAPGPRRPHPETDPVVQPGHDPKPYVWSKITDEVVGGWVGAMQSGPEVVIGRFTNLYGPGGSDDEETGTVVHTLIRRALEASASGRPSFEVWGDLLVTRSFLYVEDAAEAVALLALGPFAGVYNIDNGEPLTIGALAREIAFSVNRRLEPDAPVSDTGAVPYRVTDPAKIFGAGFSPRMSLAEGISRSVEAARG